MNLGSFSFHENSFLLELKSDMLLSELMKSLRGFSGIRIYYTNLNILLQFLNLYVGYKPSQNSRLNILCISNVLNSNTISHKND